MRRWNGWGDDTTSYPLPDEATAYLEQLVGPGERSKDATLNNVLFSVPASRLPDHPLINTDPLQRLRHARGQSLPDWIALRSGRINQYPDGVAFPSEEEDVTALVEYAVDADISLIPYGGGTSVVGHINPLPSDRPVLTVNLRRLSQLKQLDKISQLATFGAGIQGPDLEALLRAQGYTLGHFPQSFELSTLGGWIATRSTGQQSLGYGRIESLFAGGTLVSPAGTLRLAPSPASAAGPDLRHLLLGSEGRLGVITEAIMRVAPLPEREAFHAVFFPGFEEGLEATREIAQANIPLSMLRLSTDVETATTLALAGHRRLVGTLERLLSLRKIGDGKCLLLLGFSGNHDMVGPSRRIALGMCSEHGGVHVGRTFGAQWQKGRFLTPYLRNTLWDAGYAVDTVETATTWRKVPEVIGAIEGALRSGLSPLEERVHVFTHLSHVYADGASVYTTYLFRHSPDPDETLHRWSLLKKGASDAIVDCQATISHQHGVGMDHLPYLEAEKGALGMATFRALTRLFDPQGVMNPGKLVP